MKRVQSDGKVKGSGNMKELCKKCAEEMLENNFPTPLLLIHPYTHKDNHNHASYTYYDPIHGAVFGFAENVQACVNVLNVYFY